MATERQLRTAVGSVTGKPPTVRLSGPKRLGRLDEAVANGAVPREGPNPFAGPVTLMGAGPPH